MNCGLLRYIIARNKETPATLSKDLGIHPQTMYRKLRGQNEFTVNEVKKIIRRYQLTPEAVMKIFFK